VSTVTGGALGPVLPGAASNIGHSTLLGAGAGVGSNFLQ